MAKTIANSGDSDQMPRYAASDLGLLCLSITILGVFRLQWVQIQIYGDSNRRGTYNKTILPGEFGTQNSPQF